MADHIEGESIGAEPRALAFIALDGRRNAWNGDVSGNQQVLGAGPVQLNQARPRRAGLAGGQADIQRQIVPEPDHRHGLLRRRLRIHPNIAGRHGAEFSYRT